MPHGKRLILFVLACLVATQGCEPENRPADYTARLGDTYLTRDELANALAALPPRQDSTEARRQVVEQWVTNELLFQEALARSLDQDPDVRRLLEESKRSVLVSALISRLYEESPSTPAPAEMQAYFERNKEQLRLLEPFVHVRHLAAESADEAAAARSALAQAQPAERDSLWHVLTARYAVDPQGSEMLSQNYIAESRLFGSQPVLRAAVMRLRPGELAPVLRSDSLHHVLQLVTRVPAGTIPEPAWIEEELTRRLLIESRKQLYARQVQRLRTEALAREALEILE